jgi:DNA modification methylase
MYETGHRTTWEDAREISSVPPGSVDLVVTSPPYPMIELWDDDFTGMNPDIGGVLKEENGGGAFELMHRELDKVWERCGRALREGGMLCINIGDATRRIGGGFQLYPNHERVLRAFMDMGGYSVLPMIHWRKSTNAPTKFMGSGMLPPGAYVTLEHEYILILRRGRRRSFDTPEERLVRRKSGYFWEERNLWFSDLWRIPGRNQSLAEGAARRRSGAFPLELAYRLICMYSIIGDCILDPFAGTGTSALAAMAACRNSRCVEKDRRFAGLLTAGAARIAERANALIDGRLVSHRLFCERHGESSPGRLAHRNRSYGFPVMTGQETDILFPRPTAVLAEGDGRYRVVYEDPAGAPVSSGGERGEGGA